MLVGALGVAPAAAAPSDDIAALVNQERWAQGLNGLARNPDLDAVANAWAQRMAAENRLYHNPDVGTQIPGGWQRWGENVAEGYDDAAEMHTAWMNSPGHRANVLGDFTDIGVAYVVVNGHPWGVQVFAAYPGHGGVAPPAPEPEAAPVPVVPSPEPPPVVPSPTPTPSPTPSLTPTPTPVPSPTPSAVTTPTAAPTPAANGAETPDAAPVSASTPLPAWAWALLALLVAAAVAAAVLDARRRRGAGASRGSGRRAAGRWSGGPPRDSDTGTSG